MQFRHEFPIPVDASTAFATLTDLERVVACVPGVRLTGRDAGGYHATLRLRIGSLPYAYQGTVTLADADPAACRARLRAAGRETTGQGAVRVTVEATVHPAGAGASTVTVATELELDDRTAQAGREVVGDVVGRMLRQFARNLEALPGTGRHRVAAPAPRPATTEAHPPAPRAPAGIRHGVVGVALGFVFGWLARGARR